MKYFQQPLPGHLKPWLTHAGSFMERARQAGLHPKVQVLNETWVSPFSCEKKLLNLSFRSVALIREVMISSEKKPLMYARTIIPIKTLSGAEKQLAHLKNRSLGSILFKDQKLERSPFEFFVLQEGHYFYARMNKLIDFALPSELWARRSLFLTNKKKVLLTEVFFDL